MQAYNIVIYGVINSVQIVLSVVKLVLAFLSTEIIFEVDEETKAWLIENSLFVKDYDQRLGIFIAGMAEIVKLAIMGVNYPSFYYLPQIMQQSFINGEEELDYVKW